MDQGNVTPKRNRATGKDKDDDERPARPAQHSRRKRSDHLQGRRCAPSIGGKRREPPDTQEILENGAGLSGHGQTPRWNLEEGNNPPKHTAHKRRLGKIIAKEARSATAVGSLSEQNAPVDSEAMWGMFASPVCCDPTSRGANFQIGMSCSQRGNLDGTNWIPPMGLHRLTDVS